jgi:hypothetical protein
VEVSFVTHANLKVWIVEGQVEIEEAQQPGQQNDQDQGA